MTHYYVVEYLNLLKAGTNEKHFCKIFTVILKRKLQNYCAIIEEDVLIVVSKLWTIYLNSETRFQAKITGTERPSVNLMQMYKKPVRPSFITLQGPKSYFAPHSDSTYFNGQNWISYDTSLLDPSFLRPNTREELHLRFRASEPNSPIWYSEDGDRKILVTLQVLILKNNAGWRPTSWFKMRYII